LLRKLHRKLRLPSMLSFSGLDTNLNRITQFHYFTFIFKTNTVVERGTVTQCNQTKTVMGYFDHDYTVT
jgi:hypothetical protein